MFCLVFLVRIFYPTKIRTPYFARIFYPTKIRASYSVRIIFIRRILERSRVHPARISSVYVVPGTVSHVLPTFSILGALPAPLRSARTSPLASSTSRGWWRLILVRYLWPRTIQSPYANRRRASHVGREGGRDAERGDCVRAMSRHYSPVDVEERAKDVVVRGFKPHTFVGMLREAVDDQVRPASDG